MKSNSQDQTVYQPNAAERAALAAAGYTGFPASGENASNTPFPYWRCLANVLLVDEPSEKCNGLINRTRTGQEIAGLAGQITLRQSAGRVTHQLTTGGSFDGSHVDFSQSTE